MAYYKVICKGGLGVVESFSFGVSFGVVGLSPDVPDQAATDGLLANLRAWTTTGTVPTAHKTLLSLQGSIAGWRVEKRAEDERTLNVSEGLIGTPVTGTNNATKTPQDAVVFSLRTTTPGPRGRGRLYYPALGASIDNSFQMTGPTPASLITDTKTWLAAMETQLNAYFIGIADSRRLRLSVRSVTDHVCRDVVQIQIGSVLDTQRRRRDTLPETYQSVAYP